MLVNKLRREVGFPVTQEKKQPTSTPEMNHLVKVKVSTVVGSGALTALELSSPIFLTCSLGWFHFWSENLECLGNMREGTSESHQPEADGGMGGCPSHPLVPLHFLV